MKFGEELQRLAIPEWKSKYLDYSALVQYVEKDIRPTFGAGGDNAHDSSSEEMQSETEGGESQPSSERASEVVSFWTLLAGEMKKVDGFAQSELKKINSWHHVLKEQIKEMRAKIKIRRRPSSGSAAHDSASPSRRSSVSLPPVREDAPINVSKFKSICSPNPEKLASHKLRKAMEASYREMDMLKSFIELNKKAIRKIKKKHKKNRPDSKDVKNETGFKLLSFSSAFEEERVKMVRWTEKTFTDVLEKGDRQRAMRTLRVTEDKFQPINWSTVRVGMLLGGSFILIAVVLILASYYNPANANNTTWPADYERHKVNMFETFGGLVAPAIAMLLVGFNLHVFADKGINYVLIFGLDPNSRTTAVRSKVIEAGSWVLFAWSLLFLSFLYWPYHETIPSRWVPFTMIMVLVFTLVDPIGWILAGKFMWVPRTVGRMVMAPFFAVKFADFWLADQLCSMSFSMQSLVRAVHFMLHGFKAEPYLPKENAGLQALVGVFGALPYIFRFLQCLRRYRDEDNSAFPHLVNGGKYFTSIMVVLSSTFYGWYDSKPALAMFIILAIASTCYSFWWDIVMDWGLPIFGSKIRKGNTNMYAIWTYTAAEILDLILRLSWTISLSLHLVEHKIGPVGNTAKIVLAVVEVFRRFVWNFFRLENEHLNNCGRYRATKEIAVPFEYLASRPMAFGSYHETEFSDSDAQTVNQLLAISPLGVIAEVSPSLPPAAGAGAGAGAGEENVDSNEDRTMPTPTPKSGRLSTSLKQRAGKRSPRKTSVASSLFMHTATGRIGSNGDAITWGDEVRGSSTDSLASIHNGASPIAPSSVATSPPVQQDLVQTNGPQPAQPQLVTTQEADRAKDGSSNEDGRGDEEEDDFVFNLKVSEV